MQVCSVSCVAEAWRGGNRAGNQTCVNEESWQGRQEENIGWLVSKEGSGKAP